MRKRSIVSVSEMAVAKIARGSERPAAGVDPVGDPEHSSTRPKVPGAVPAAWLDRLLAVVVDLPLAGGERAVVEALVQSLGSMLPSYAVGARIAADAGRPATLAVRCMPGGSVARVEATALSRMFATLAHEYVVRLPPGTTESALHLASDEDDLDPATSPAVHLVDRAAMIMSRTLPTARVASTAAQLRRRMIQAEKLATFGQLAAGLVHELNNPLTSIVAYSSYLTQQAENGGRDAEEIERLRRIHDAANRMMRFTRELVAYARPSSDSQTPVVVHDVLDQAIAFCEHVLSAARVRVERHYGADVRRVLGAGEQLVQVFVNLFTNACQAALPSGGVIRVTTSTRSDGGERRVVVDVADDGSGISPEHLGQVFRPFFTTKRDSHGTGLGLSIVKSIVDGHDGDIRVESEPGRGARFVVELPEGADASGSAG